MVFHEILWDSLTSPIFPLLLSTFPHIYLLFPTHTLFFPIISCVFPHVSLILFSQNSVLFAGNNVETTQLYICVRQWDNMMKVGMAATAIEIDGFSPEAVNLERRRQLIREGKEKKMALTTEGILKFLNMDHA